MKKEETKFTVRIHPETARKLACLASYYGRSVNREIDWLIKQEIASFEREHGPIEREAQEEG